jgi:DNA-binding NtrC family response regulator
MKSKKKTVVLVDRDVLALDVIRQVLELYGGFCVHVAHDLAGAKDALNLAEAVDVLVADAFVAGCESDSDLCGHAIERHPSIAIILTSDSVQETIPDAPARCRILTKPFGIDALLAAIDPKVRAKFVQRKSPLTADPIRGLAGSLVHPCLNRQVSSDID